MTATLCAMLLAAGAELLGQPLRQDGYTMRPPLGFRMTRMDLFRASRVGAVGERDDTSRHLSAALVDSDGEDASSVLVAVAERGFRPSTTAKDELSGAVVKHFCDELGLTFTLDRSEVVPGSSPRVEVRGTVREGSQLRQVIVAAFAGEVRHVVVTVSVPSGRWEALAESVRASLDSLKPDSTASASASRAVAMAVAALIGSALLFSIGLWRRRRALS